MVLDPVEPSGLSGEKGRGGGMISGGSSGSDQSQPGRPGGMVRPEREREGEIERDGQQQERVYQSCQGSGRGR